MSVIPVCHDLGSGEFEAEGVRRVARLVTFFFVVALAVLRVLRRDVGRRFGMAPLYTIDRGRLTDPDTCRDEGQMPVLFGVVQSVPDNKDILDREPHKLDRDMLAAPRRFVQKAHAAKRPRVLGQQALTQRVQCGTRIDNVLDDQYILSAHVAWLQAPDESLGGYCFPSIARTAYEVDRDRPRKCAREVGQKHESPGEHANKMDGNLKWGLGLDSGGQLCHPLLNSSGREKRGEGGRGLAHESSRVLHPDAYSVRVQTAWGSSRSQSASH